MVPLLHAPKTTYPNSGEALPILYESKAILRRVRPRADWVAKVISRIGKKAGGGRGPGKPKDWRAGQVCFSARSAPQLFGAVARRGRPTAGNLARVAARFVGDNPATLRTG